jgi:hypothetical protein
VKKDGNPKVIYIFKYIFTPGNIEFYQKVHRGIKRYGETLLLFGETYTVWRNDIRMAKG